MVMLCFLLDLRSLSPPLLRDLKQSFLQLANFYTISAPISERPRSKALSDRIGLCYVLKNRTSCSDELKVAYSPRGNFSLRDFHHAVNNLPTDAFLPEFNNAGALSFCDVKLSSILSDKVLYSWGSDEKDIARKIILISSCLVESVDPAMRKTLMDAADNCVSVEFILLEQKSSHLGDMPENVNNFVKHICDLENCSFRTYLPDAQVFCGLVKRWLQELKDDMEEPLQARFIFKNNILGSVNQIYCNLCTSVNHVIDRFSPCQTCRCHGIPLADAIATIKGSSCPVTGDELGAFDLITNSVKVGDHTLLFLPSFQICAKLHKVSSPIDFNIIERTNLGSLSEGVIFGTSYILTPSAFHESDDIDKLELNIQVFQGLCSSLHSLDQGLVCSSNFNMETTRETSFYCYYILLPSNKGLMLLRRVAGLEEIFPIPDVGQLSGSSASREIENSVRASLLKLEVRDYNPILHERGIHQKLNFLVKESLQFGSIPPDLKDVSSEQTELNSTHPDSTEKAVPSKPNIGVVVIEEEIPHLDVIVVEDKTTACIAAEWEQLIVNEVPEKSSPSYIFKPKLDKPALSPVENNRQLDEKTSRILERLEVPRQLKTKVTSPVITSSIRVDSCVPKMMPLIPFPPIQASDQGAVSSQPMKPNFQRLKRKHR